MNEHSNIRMNKPHEAIIQPCDWCKIEKRTNFCQVAPDHCYQFNADLCEDCEQICMNARMSIPDDIWKVFQIYEHLGHAVILAICDAQNKHLSIVWY